MDSSDQGDAVDDFLKQAVAARVLFDKKDYAKMEKSTAAEALAQIHASVEKALVSYGCDLVEYSESRLNTYGEKLSKTIEVVEPISGGSTQGKRWSDGLEIGKDVMKHCANTLNKLQPAPLDKAMKELVKETVLITSSKF